MPAARSRREAGALRSRLVAVPNPERELARLQSALRPEPPAVVVVTGPSAFFRGEALELVFAALPTSADVRRLDGSEKSDGGELVDLRGGGLFGSGTWVCVRRGEGWLKEHGEALLGTLPRIAKGCGLVLEVVKLDKRTKLSKELTRVGAVFELRDLYAEPYDRSRSALEAELVGWVVQRAKKAKLALTPEAAFLVISTVGKEPAELVAEIARLGERLPAGRPIGTDDVRGHLTVSFESTPFEFADAVLAYDRRRAMRSLDAMFARGVRGRDGAGMDAGGIFPFVTSWLWQTFHSVHHGRALCDGGVRSDEVAARAGVRTFADRYRAQVERNPERRLRRGLALLLEAQRQLRSAGEEPQAVLERFLARYFAEGAA